MKKLFLTLLIIFSFSATALLEINAAQKRRGAYQVTAKAAILSDSTNLKRLYGKNVHKQILPASTTKVMTALVVLERLPLDKYVTVPFSATKVQPSKLYLRAGEKYKVRDLLYAVLLNSANDASVVLAIAVAGSEAEFVRLMNKKAKSLGAIHTHFVNSHGLPSRASQYSTPYDMYLIFREALKKDFFAQAITYKFRMIYSKDGRQLVLRSHNKMLFKGWEEPIYGKTGYTRMARSCFVGYVDKGKRRLIVAVFGCTRRWDDIKYIIENFGRVNL